MMSSPTTRAMMAARGKIPRTKQASSSSLLSPRRSPRHAAKQPATPPSTSLLSNSSDSDYSNNSGLLTPHSLTPEPTPTTRKKLYDKEIKAKAKARAAFNAIKLRNKLGSLKSARKKSTRMQSTSLKKRPSTTRNGTDNDDTDQALSPSASACDPVNNSSDDDLDKHIDGLGESGGNDNNNNDEGTPQPSEHLLRLRHRQVFMERAFGDEDGNNSVAVRPQVEIDEIVFILQHWEVGKKISSLIGDIDKYRVVKRFRETHKSGYKYEKAYLLEYIRLPDGTSRPVLRRQERGKANGGRIVVSREQVFDAIDEWHSIKGHMGMERTHAYCRQKYYNTTQALCRLYVETCYVCAQRNPTVKALRGSRQPIRSNHYRERFQVDLIDFRKMRKRDPFGVLMRWIVTVKDHSTGFTHISAIPRKTARHVAHRLQELFGLIGYPAIFHTDNGKEFTARSILQFLRRVNPNILTVTGRPRKPSDQGSVERMNRLVKRVIGSELAERRMAGENPNWTEVLGSVMAAINSQTGRCAYSSSSFQTIFGQQYDQDISCSKEEARQCWTVDERLKATNNTEFVDVASHYYAANECIEEADSLASVDSWSVDSARGNDSDNDEVDDETFEQYCPVGNHPSISMKNTSMKVPPTKANVPNELPSAKRNVPEEVQYIPHTGEPGNMKKRYTIKEAWERNAVSEELVKSKSRSMDVYKFVHSYLYCKECTDHGSVAISIGDDKYREACMHQKWYDTQFILSFCALIAHDAHLKTPTFADGPNRVKMIHCLHPNASVSNEQVIKFDNVITHFVMIALSNQHFAVLDFDIHARSVAVFDGLNYAITNWKNHVIHTLRQYGIVDLSLTPKCKYSSSLVGGSTKQYLEIKFGEEAPWIMTNLRHHKQRDSHNCGPIACLKIMEIYGYIEKGYIEIIAGLLGGYRGFVMNKFDELCNTYDSQMFVETKMLVDDNGNVVDEDEINKQAEVQSTNEDVAAITDGLAIGLPSEHTLTVAEDKNEAADAAADATDAADNANVAANAAANAADAADVADAADEGPWKQCNRCAKWRHLPATVNLESLPEPWFCELNIYDPKQNKCEANEHTLNEVAKEKKLAKKLEGLASTPSPYSKRLSKRVKYQTAKGKDYYANLYESEPNEMQVHDRIEESVRKTAVEKKRKMQEVNANKAMKQRGDVLIAKGLGRGAVLSLKVDYRTHSHACGLLAIVYKSNDTGAALVCCQHGVVTHDGSKRDYWVPSDKFKVYAGHDENTVITPSLQEVRDDIMKGVYDYKSKPRISYSKYHELVIGATSPCKRSACSCKNGCTKRCRCRQKNVVCNSTCLCLGNCTWSAGK